jgi:hypothetical protein
MMYVHLKKRASSQDANASADEQIYFNCTLSAKVKGRKGVRRVRAVVNQTGM